VERDADVVQSYQPDAALTGRREETVAEYIQVDNMEFKAAVSWAVSVAGYLAVQKDEFVTVHCFGGPDEQEQFGWAFASKGVQSGWIPQRVLGDPVTQSECICCMDRLATFVGSCGHLVACDECRPLLDKSEECPVCAQPGRLKLVSTFKGKIYCP
jgi:hypothetical protein